MAEPANYNCIKLQGAVKSYASFPHHMARDELNGAHIGSHYSWDLEGMERDFLDGPIYQVWGQSHASNPFIRDCKFNEFILKKKMTFDPTVQSIWKGENLMDLVYLRRSRVYRWFGCIKKLAPLCCPLP